MLKTKLVQLQKKQQKAVQQARTAGNNNGSQANAAQQRQLLALEADIQALKTSKNLIEAEQTLRKDPEKDKALKAVKDLTEKLRQEELNCALATTKLELEKKFQDRQKEREERERERERERQREREKEAEDRAKREKKWLAKVHSAKNEVADALRLQLAHYHNRENMESLFKFQAAMAGCKCWWWCSRSRSRTPIDARFPAHIHATA